MTMHFDAPPNNGKMHLPGLACRPQQCSLTKQFQDRGGQFIALAIMVFAVVTESVLQASPAAANFVDNLKDAVMQAHGGTSCGPLRSEPLADQTATIINKHTDAYLNHAARVVPGHVDAQGRLVVDPLPILKDLGSNAGKAMLLQGAGKTEADAISFILISGYRVISDCSFTEYGVSALPNNNPDGYFLTALVLAGS